MYFATKYATVTAGLKWAMEYLPNKNIIAPKPIKCITEMKPIPKVLPITPSYTMEPVAATTKPKVPASSAKNITKFDLCIRLPFKIFDKFYYFGFDLVADLAHLLN